MTDSLRVPTLHLLAGRDRIAPLETAAAGDAVQIPAGNVGMIVGSARNALHQRLTEFLG